MRKVYRNFTNKQDISDSSILDQYRKQFILETDNKFVNRVVDKLSEDFDFTVKNESYWRVEHRPSGHQWHKDTGSSNGMMWCQVGVSILLEDGISGGETFYGKINNDENPIKSDREIYDLVAHTSDEWHMVTPHEGKRVVFLMFI